jgi:hypothetical protein
MLSIIMALLDDLPTRKMQEVAPADPGGPTDRRRLGDQPRFPFRSFRHETLGVLMRAPAGADPVPREHRAAMSIGDPPA